MKWHPSQVLNPFPCLKNHPKFGTPPFFSRPMFFLKNSKKFCQMISRFFGSIVHTPETEAVEVDEVLLDDGVIVAVGADVEVAPL